ncbi:hypothetical protein O6H91_06G070400 [Diphasiastrum complanatum]|nr:hypothetical protein O6H91_06G070400 [Diphasiastrum complanatum]
MKLAEEIVESMATAQLFAIRVDCSDAQSIKEAFEAVHSLGVVEVLVYNMCTRFPWPHVQFTDIDPQSFQHSLTLPSMGAFFCCKEVLPGLVKRRRGTILFTGAAASVRGELGFAELACGKFALRGLAQCLAREYHPQGIHVAHIMIDGNIAAQSITEESSGLDPDSVANVYWQLHVQDKSAWTQELDLRPFCEIF